MYFIHPFARERDRAIELSSFLHFQTELISLQFKLRERCVAIRPGPSDAQNCAHSSSPSAYMDVGLG